MAKIFNVDALAKEERAITLGGVNHPVIDMSVDAYLATMKLANELDKPENKDSQEAQINAVVNTICLAVPSISAEVLRSLPFDQMNAISQFVRGEVPDVLKDAVITQVTTEETIEAEKLEAKND